MKKTNFHTHTFRCGHAVGNEDVMVKAAIENNIEVLGFSCHVPLPKYRWHLCKGMRHAVHDARSFASFSRAFLKNGPAMRMPYSNKDTHLQRVKEAKNKYQGLIKIHQGFEAEYFEEYLAYYQELLDSGEVEYFILGHHFHKYSIHSCYYGKPRLSDEEVLLYKEEVLKAFDTDLFSYFAHPDLFMIGKIYFDEVCEIVTREICLKAKEKDIPLEINAGGMRRGTRVVDGIDVYPYPNSHFWKIVGEIGNKVIMGIDAHRPEDFNDESYIALLDFAKRHKLHVVDSFTFKKGKNK